MSMPAVMRRVESVREFRLKSKKAATRRNADIPTLFTEIRQPDTNYLMVPRVSSVNRRYLPIKFANPYTVASDGVQVVPNATLYHFGVLTSNIHMAWMRTVCGRLKSDYNYSGTIVYNNFPWCSPTDEQKAEIEKRAQDIINARAIYMDSSLADMYGEKMYMFPELLKAHQANDQAVMRAYGFKKDLSESAIVAELMKMYQKLTKEN